jgi:uncharacterized repeat protein (TIGR04076 family)
MTKIIAKVISQKGTCEAGHQLGDEFTIGEMKQPDMCPYAFYVLFPFAQVLLFGGAFPWEKDPDKTTVACPDPGNPVIFELRRVE